MDAVHGFVRAHGGSITLVLDESTFHDEHRPFATVIRLPAKLAVTPILRLLQQLG
jgi:hypothetical protein